MKKLLIFILLFTFTIDSFSQSNSVKFDIANCKLKLTQNLLTCHSLIVTALGEKELKQKYYLGDKAFKYYELAMTQFSQLKENVKLDENLTGEIGKILEAYGLIVVDKSKLSKPEISFALKLLESKYKVKVMPKLWDEQPLP